jgi:hypothetical protein
MSGVQVTAQSGSEEPLEACRALSQKSGAGGQEPSEKDTTHFSKLAGEKNKGWDNSKREVKTDGGMERSREIEVVNSWVRRYRDVFLILNIKSNHKL